MFAVSAGLCGYNFFRAITLDPGTCPKPSSDEELRSVSRLGRVFLISLLKGRFLGH